MSRVLISALVFLCLLGASGTRGQIGPAGLIGLLSPASGVSVSRTFGTGGNNGGSTVASFSATFAYGAPAQSNRIVVLGLAMIFPSGGSISTVTIGGISATLLDTVSNSTGITQLWAANVPTGTSGTVAVTAGSGTFSWTAFTESVLNAQPSPSQVGHDATATSAPSVSLTEPSRSVVTAIGLSVNTVPTNPIWTNVTSDNTQGFGSVHTSFASAAFPSAASLAVRYSIGGTSFNSLVAAVWAPM